MLFLFAQIVLSIEKCSITVQGGSVSSVNAYNQCNNLTFEKITAENDIFINSGLYMNSKQHINITIIKSDLSRVTTFISDFPFPGALKNITITVINSTICRAFKGDSRISEIKFIDCVLDVGLLTKDNHSFYAPKMYFYNCEFVGKHTRDQCGIIHFERYNKFNSILIEFIDCKFNMDRDWNTQEVNGSSVYDPQKHFILVKDQGGKLVQINFIRCDAGLNLIDDRLKLLRFSNRPANDGSVIVQGKNNGIAIDWSWALNDNEIFVETDWTTVVKDDGYDPIIPLPTETPKDSGEINNEAIGKIRIWKIITFTLSGVSTVLLIIVLVTCVIKRQKYNRSE